MSIQILSVTANNFKSFKTLSLEIKEGVYHIFGDNQDDSYSNSNGAGKTSILDAIYWCLSGDTLQGSQSSDDVVNMKTGKNCHVRVHLISNEIGYYISRYRKDSLHSNSIVIQSEDLTDLSSHRIADNQKRIREIIGVDFSMLKSILMLDSRMSGSFTSMSNVDRLNFLESVRDYSIWDSARTKASNELLSLNNRDNELSLAIESLRSGISTNKKLILSMREELKDLSVKELNDELSVLEESLSQKVKMHTVYSSYSSKYEEDNTDLDKKILEQHNVMVSCNDTQKKLQEKYRIISDSLRECKKEVSTLESFSNGICPTCGQCVDHKHDESKIVELQDKKLELESNEVSLHEEISRYSKEYDDLCNEYNTLLYKKNESYNCLKDVKERKDSLDVEIASINKKINDKKEKISGIDSIKTSYENRISSMEEEVKNDVSSLLELLEERSRVRDRSSYVLFWKEAWGAKGSFRPMLLSNDIKYINSCLENYSKRVFSETQVQLSIPDKDNRKIEILVNNRTTGSKNIQMLSGGERRRLDLVIQLSILSLFMSATSFSCNVLFVDEVFDSLDSEGIYRVLSLLQDIGMSSIYVISHNEEIKSYIQNHIKVTKTNGISVLEG